MSGLAVETNVLTSCIGVPTCRVKDDHGPSSPSLKHWSKHCGYRVRIARVYQFCAGAMEMGVGVAARSRRAKQETRTTSRDCTSHRKAVRVEDCILNPSIGTPPEPEGHNGPKATNGKLLSECHATGVARQHERQAHESINDHKQEQTDNREDEDLTPRDVVAEFDACQLRPRASTN